MLAFLQLELVVLTTARYVQREGVCVCLCVGVFGGVACVHVSDKIYISIIIHACKCIMLSAYICSYVQYMSAYTWVCV